MKFNFLKVMLVFFALLMFAFTGELAAEDLVIQTGDVTLELNDEQDFVTRLTASGIGVEGEWIYFSLSPGLGELDSDELQTNESGYVTAEYSTGTEAGVDTLIAYWADEVSRAEAADTVLITINPGAATSLDVTPGDTTVVVTEDATIVVELWDDYLNHVDATSESQVSFSTSGKGTFDAASVNVESGCIEVAYTTDDSMATDVITTELLVNHTRDYDTVRTIGAAPASMVLTAEPDSEVVVGGSGEDLVCSLFDAYGNHSIYSNYYGHGTYKVSFDVSEGGGTFASGDSTFVDTFGVGYKGYLSSTVAGVYTVTATSGAATADMDITQTPAYVDSLVLTPDSMAIPAGSPITLTVEAFDVFSNHINMTNIGWVSIVTDEGLHGQGSLSGKTLNEDGTISMDYTCDGFDADTAHVWTYYNTLRSQLYDTVVVFSAEPGEFDHYALDISEGQDTSNVSDGDYDETNWVRIEAQDANDIRLYTYTNPDTITMSLGGSTADSAQVTWFITEVASASIPTPAPFAVGLNAYVPENWFYQGVAYAGVANQVAENATVTATDTAGHTGTSPELTWLPIDVVTFNVGLESGADTIETNVTVNVEVTAIDTFGNTTNVGLPLNVVLSANRAGVDFPGTTHLMETAVTLFPTIATEVCTGLIITVADLLNPGINGSSYPIEVIPSSGVGEVPIVSNISAKFGSGDILCAVAEEGNVDVKVYNKVGMEVGTLLNGVVKPGYYPVSLKGLNLSSDIYFVVMEGPGVTKRIKATLIK